MQTFLTLTLKLTDILIECFTQDSSPSLPEIFDVSMANLLDYFNVLFQPEIFGDVKDYINKYAIFKQGEIQRKRNNPDCVDSVWQATTVEN